MTTQQSSVVKINYLRKLCFIESELIDNDDSHCIMQMQTYITPATSVFRVTETNQETGTNPSSTNLKLTLELLKPKDTLTDNKCLSHVEYMMSLSHHTAELNNFSPYTLIQPIDFGILYPSWTYT